MPTSAQAERILAFAELGDNIACFLIGQEKLFCGSLS